MSGFLTKNESESLVEFLTTPLFQVWQRLLQPFLVRLDAELDRRLVGTLAQMVRTIIENRHCFCTLVSCGLLLSEPGAHLLSPSQALAGTKRLFNLLRSTGQHGLDCRDTRAEPGFPGSALSTAFSPHSSLRQTPTQL